MTRTFSLFLVLAGLALARPGPDTALRMEPAPRLAESVSVETTGRCPPSFLLKMELSMPTPGWKLAVDDVFGPDEEGRFRIRVTGTPPQGIVAQVVTGTPVEVHLPSVRKGRYLVDLFYRARPDGRHARFDAFVLQASGLG